MATTDLIQQAHDVIGNDGKIEFSKSEIRSYILAMRLPPVSTVDEARAHSRAARARMEAALAGLEQAIKFRPAYTPAGTETKSEQEFASLLRQEIRAYRYWRWKANYMVAGKSLEEHVGAR